MDALPIAKQHVSAIASLHNADWQPAATVRAGWLRLNGNTSENHLCVATPAVDARVIINYRDVRNCRVHIGQGLRGTLTINLCCDGALVVVGNDCQFNQLEIRSRQPEDLIAVGDGVIVTGPGTWVSGLRAGAAQPAIIVGDCCLIGREVLLRNSDGHPVLDRNTLEQRNSPRGPLLIEPHVWLGERSAVLKNVTVGAFAIVGLGAVVNRDVPRFATAIGNPAQVTVRADRFWAADDSPAGIARAQHYLERYS